MNPIKGAVTTRVDAAASNIVRISHEIHARPELAWQEVGASRLLCDELERVGMAVQRQAHGLETAFVASAGSGDLEIALCAEYDALPGMGHACGHNIIAAAAVGTATALMPLLDELGLTLRVIGTPAEEGKGGKIELLEHGAFVGLHGAMMVHPGPVSVPRCVTSAVSHLTVSYQGRAAHSAGFPELGVNAADAFTIAQVSIGLLRQHLPKDVMVHGIVTRGGEAPNAVPASTAGSWYVRGATLRQLQENEPRVLHCFEAGAQATGCELSVTYDSKPYAEFRNSEVLLRNYCNNVDLPEGDEQATGSGMARSSTDMGNVSSVVPSIHPYIGIGSGAVVNHQPEFAMHSVTGTADKALLRACRAMGHTIVAVATSDHERQALKEEAASLLPPADRAGDQREALI